MRPRKCSYASAVIQPEPLEPPAPRPTKAAPRVEAPPPVPPTKAAGEPRRDLQAGMEEARRLSEAGQRQQACDAYRALSARFPRSKAVGVAYVNALVKCGRDGAARTERERLQILFPEESSQP